MTIKCERSYHSDLVTTMLGGLIFVGALFTAPAAAQRKEHPEFIDQRIGLGIVTGTTNGLHASICLPLTSQLLLRGSAEYGGGLARWGIAEAYEVQLGVSILTSDDGENDAFFFTPSAAYGMMIGDPATQWWKFGPYEDVQHVALQTSYTWLHLWRSLGMELGGTLGVARALNGIDKSRNEATGEISFQIRGHFALLF